MGRVVFVPTGRMELAGLPVAFKGLFPRHEFTCVSKFGSPDDPYDGFTSADTTGWPTLRQDTRLAELVQVAAVQVSARRPPEHVVVLEDLELANTGAIHAVVGWFRGAAEEFADADDGSGGHRRQVLRERMSFHLAVPMIESWLFADPQGPARAGAHRQHALANTDAEDFETDDPDYVADDGLSCQAWRELSVRPRKELTVLEKRRLKKCKPGWLRDDRKRHPKAFLQWLCSDPADSCTCYSESRSGASALKQLDWAEVLQAPGMQFLRALVEDVAFALEEDLPHTPWPNDATEVTRYRPRASDLILRKI